MESNDIGWASFYNEASTQFSNSFQEKMSNQLMHRFDAHLNIENAAKNRGFHLFVGMEEMQTTYDNGYAFAVVEIISPNSFSTKLTAYWKTEKLEDLQNATTTNDSLNNKNIEFGWCADFEKEKFLPFFDSRNKLDKKENNLTIDVEFDPTLYPDLSVKIYCKEGFNKADLNEINKILNHSITDAYISEIKLYEDTYMGVIDFQNSSIKNGSQELLMALQELSKLKLSSKIQIIRIE